MDPLFAIQLITSFVIGGVFIALLSLLAERASEKVAGLIISLPATIALGFFFIGWTLSPQAVADIAPMIPLMEGVVMMFTVAYLYLSKVFSKKLPSITLSVAGSLIVWFVLAVPLAIFEFSNLFLSLAGYVILAALAYYLITMRPNKKSFHKPLKYTLVQKIWRAVFAGSIITLAVFLSKVSGPFWGGLFTAFPAVFISSLTIVHWHYDSAFLFKVWKNSPLGSLIFTIYPLVSIYTFPAFGIWGGTLTSYLVCLVAFIVLRKLKIATPDVIESEENSGQIISQ